MTQTITAPKKSVGRPSKYDPAICETVIDLMEQGYSKEAVAGKLRIHKDTLYQWLDKYSELSDAINVGEGLSRFEWEKIGLDGAKGKIEKFNASSYIFNMKNRFGWRDKQEVEHSGTVTQAIININLAGPVQHPDNALPTSNPVIDTEYEYVEAPELD